MVQECLPMLRAGDGATIVAINGAAVGAKRLADLGFVRGARLTMVRPGRPCIVRIQGRCVSLGNTHQQNIRLSRFAPPDMQADSATLNDLAQAS